MSTAEILSLISLISYIIAGIALVLAVFFWFFFKIPSVIGDLSGRTAKKSIARKRASNERSGGKGYQPSATNVNRGKLTDTMQHSRKLKNEPKKAKPVDESQMPETGLLESNKAEIVDNKIFTGLVAGRLSKQIKEVCLLEQAFVRSDLFEGDVKGYVASVAKALGAEISVAKYVRFEKGEGIEKKQDDFAAEIASMVK